MNQQMWASSPTRENLEPPVRPGRGCSRAGIGQPGLRRRRVPGACWKPWNWPGTAPELFAIPASLTGRRVVITAGPTQRADGPGAAMSATTVPARWAMPWRRPAPRPAHVVTLSSAGRYTCRPRSACSGVNVGSGTRTCCQASDDGPWSAGCDLFVAAAAVADYRPVSVAEHKIKKAWLQCAHHRAWCATRTLSSHDRRRDRIVPSWSALPPKPRQVEEYAQGKLQGQATGHDRLQRCLAGRISASRAMTTPWWFSGMAVARNGSTRLPKPGSPGNWFP
jgi:hypothetical protein